MLQLLVQTRAGHVLRSVLPFGGYFHGVCPVRSVDRLLVVAVVCRDRPSGLFGARESRVRLFRLRPA